MPVVKPSTEDTHDSSTSMSSPSPVRPAAANTFKEEEEEEEEDEEMDTPRRSGRRKYQRVLYGHRSPVKSVPLVPSQESESEGESRTREHETSDESGNDSDLEMPFRVASGRGLKRVASILKSTPTSKRSRRSRGTPGRRKKKVNEPAEDEDADQGTLFDILRLGKSALRAVVDDWIESYNKNRENAMVDLIQLIVQCCGCKGTVSSNMLEEEQNINAVKQLTEQFEEESHEYPLITTVPLYKRFKGNFCAFIESLITQCQHSIIYDEYMLDTLMSWLIRLSDSDVRAFRHTSTLAGMKLVTALIRVATTVKLELDNTERQLGSESHKVSSKKAHEKLELLGNKKQELKQNVNDLEEMMSFIFQGMFVHRYRDSRPEIRALCIQEIGQWMIQYSLFFLTDRYLKYIVWTLHDKVGDVRLKAILALQKLYDREEFSGDMEALTERFKDRFVAMTLDKDNDVAVEAVKLVTILLRLGKLDEEDCQQVELLVFCTHRMVAHAAGVFLEHRITTAAQQELKKTSPSKRKGSPTKGTKKSEHDFKVMQMKKLIDFLINSEIHSHGAYLVDSIWGTVVILKDWKLMTDLLMDGTKRGLNDTEEAALVEIMVCSCKQAALGQGPPGRIVRKMLSAKEKKEIVGDTKDLSAHFMHHLPDLLNKFSTEVDSATNLVQIPQLFDLEEYGQRRLNKRLEDLLEQLCDVVEKHSDNMLLEECAKTFETLTNNNYALNTTAKVSLQKLLDNVVEHFRKSLEEGFPSADGDEDQESFSLLANLRRIAAFYKYHNLEKWGIYDDLNSIIALGCKQTQPVAAEFITSALISVQMVLMWSLKELDQNHSNKTKQLKLKKCVSKYLEHCHELIQSSEEEEVKRESFMCAADILVFFANQLKQSAPLLERLVCESDAGFRNNCRDFVTEYVFANMDEEDLDEEDEDENDKKSEELSQKRVVLSAFCKLIAFGMFEMKLVGKIFAHYNKAFGNYGDIIKLTMAKCRETNRVTYTKTLLFSLQMEFESLQEEGGVHVDKTSEEFKQLKDLAHRFSLTFGVDTNKTQARESLIMLHREGIIYSFSGSSDDDVPPPNLSFLEVLNEFSPRLIPQDKSGKNGVLQYLEDHSGQGFTKRGGQWSPLITYKTALAGQEAGDNDGASGPVENQKGSRAKRKLAVDPEQVPTDKSPSGEGQWLSKKPKQKGKTPQRKTPKGSANKRQGQAKPTSGRRGRPPKAQQAGDKTAKQVQSQRKMPEADRESEEAHESGLEEDTPSQSTPGEEGEEEDTPSKSTPGEEGEEEDTPSQSTQGGEGEEEDTQSQSTQGGEGAKQDVHEKRPESIGKRKRAVSPESDKDAHEESPKQEEVDSDQEDFESLPASSQASWLSSQPQKKAYKRPRISYSKKDMSTASRSVLEEEDDDEDDDDIEEDESEDEEPAKAVIAVRREKRELPDDLFDDSQEDKTDDADTEDFEAPAFL